MRELMQAAGLTAGGFYRHFASRDDLIAEAIRTAFDRLPIMLEAEKQTNPFPQLGHIVGIYFGQSRRTVNESAPFLCPLGRLGAESSMRDLSFRAEGFEGHLTPRKADRRLSRSEYFPTDETRAEFIGSTLVGAVTLAILAIDKESGLGILNKAKLSLAWDSNAKRASRHQQW